MLELRKQEFGMRSKEKEEHAYGFNAKRDLLAQLLALNQQVAAKIEKG